MNRLPIAMRSPLRMGEKYTKVKRTPSPGGVRAHNTESEVLADVHVPFWKPALRKDRRRGKHVPKWISEKLTPVNPEDYNLKYSHPAIYEGDARWSPEHKLEAVIAYMIAGTLKGTTEICGVPYSTLQSWKRSEWWPAIFDQIRKDREAELDSKVDQTLHKAYEQIGDRIENGDYTYDRSLHQAVRVPMNARELTNVANSAHKTRSLLRGEATNITETKTREDQIKDLRAEFERFAKAKTIDSQVEK